MAEVAFAKTFLTSLDSRPIKLSTDHVENPKNFPARPPYILPRIPTSMSKPSKTTLLPGQERSITISLKSLRNPPLDIKLTSQPLNTSVLDIKHGVEAQTRIPAEKIKLLLNKRPVADSKVLKELVGSEADRAIEFSVMVIGGAAAIPPLPIAAEEKKKKEEDGNKATKGEGEGESSAQADEATVAAELETDAFWADLNGFLQQRLRNEAKAEWLSGIFKSNWESSRSSP